jgi:uncharacterized protein (DUF952 family)
MIYHIAVHSDFKAIEKNGNYRPSTFIKDGFIHCSTRSQIISVANRYYKNLKDLILLEVDEEKLDSRLIYENLEGGSELYPHIYGEISNRSIIRFAPVDDSAAGFLFPEVWENFSSKYLGFELFV